MESKGLQARRGGNDFPFSRDFGDDLVCANIACVCNSGGGRCTVPSNARLDVNGQCEFWLGFKKKLEENKEY